MPVQNTGEVSYKRCGEGLSQWALYGHQTAKNQHSCPPKLLGIMNSFELIRGHVHTYMNGN